MPYNRAFKLIEAATVSENLANLQCIVPTKESHVRELLKIESDDDRAIVLQEQEDP